MALFSVNGTALPEPKTVEPEIYDITSENTKRNQSGTLLYDYVATKRKFSVTWPPMSAAELASLIQAVPHGTFTLTFFDMATGTTQTGTFYRGDRKGSLYVYNSKSKRYENISMNFIEV